MKNLTIFLLIPMTFLLCVGSLNSQNLTPSNAKIVHGFPFHETWVTGNFIINDWAIETANWEVLYTGGNPDETATFSRNPIMNDGFSSSLTSCLINATNTTEGIFYLDFDLKLDSRVYSPAEQLTVEIQNETTWHPLITFHNEGDIEWTTRHLPVTDYVSGKMFSIRFVVSGQTTQTFNNWFIDNIHVYRDCAAPFNISSTECNLEDVLVSWEAPQEPVIAQWLYYDNGAIEYVWGNMSSDWSADQAIRFMPDQMYLMADAQITKVSVFIDSRHLPSGTTAVKIWQGMDTDTLIYQEDITAQIVIGDAMNTVSLATPVDFDHTMPLWIDLYTSGPANTYGVGICTELGGTWNQNADLLNRGNGWEHIQDLGISNRAWLIRAYITDMTKTMELGQSVPHGEHTANHNGVSSDRSLVGFNVYRSLTYPVEFEHLAFVPTVAGVFEYSHIDKNPDFYVSNYVCYQVTAVWEGTTDYCESIPGQSWVGGDMACIYIPMGIEEPPSTSQIDLYPNPTHSDFSIKSDDDIRQVRVFTLSGQQLYVKQSLQTNELQLNLTHLPPGLYLVEVQTDKGNTMKKVVVWER